MLTNTVRRLRETGLRTRQMSPTRQMADAGTSDVFRRVICLTQPISNRTITIYKDHANNSQIIRNVNRITLSGLTEILILPFNTN